MAAEKSPIIVDAGEEQETFGWLRKLSTLTKILLLLSFCLLVTVIVISVVFHKAVERDIHTMKAVEVLSDPIVKTECGKISGTVENVKAKSDKSDKSDSPVYIFKGIPYAKPPVNSLRWKPPVGLKESNACWKGTYKAKKFKSPCSQMDIWTTKKITGAEDCLYLNVWTPSLHNKVKLPVVIWIHGGYLLVGFGHQRGYSPNAESTKSMGVVFVSFNYRLNMFGFLSLDALSNASKTKTSGNYGLMDQIAVLKWVQRNIENFGGDPKKVTLIGQSSGGTSIYGLLASKGAQGLFKTVIPMSGSPVYNKTANEAAKDNLIFLNNSRCNNTHFSKVRECLYKLSKEQILNAVPWFVYPNWAMADLLDLPTKNLFDGAVCTVDGDAVSFPPGDLKLHPSWAKGEITILLGTTAQEIDWYPLQDFRNKSYAEFEGFAQKRLGAFSSAIGNKALALYKNIDNQTDPQYVYETMATDVRVTCPSNILASNFSLSPMHKVYRYIITHTPSIPVLLSTYPSQYASHMWDSVALFGFDGMPMHFKPNKSDLAFMNNLRKQFQHFFWYGHAESMDWKLYPENIGIFSNTGLQIADDYHRKQCDFWNENGFFSYGWIN